MSAYGATRVYIAGPMTGLPEWNYPAFHNATGLLREQGYTVLNPAEHFDGDTSLPRHMYLREAVRAVAQADVVLLLAGWEDSEGVRLELDTADALGIPAYRFRDFYADAGNVSMFPPLVREPAPVSPRAAILHEAARLITGDRNNQYGAPDGDFTRTAGIWQAMGFRGPDGRDLKGSDVALLMIGLKLSRATWQHKEDTFTDIGGYAGCGHEVSLIEQGKYVPTTNPNPKETA